MKNFDEIFKREIEHEQYYAFVPGDAGGETYMGIARNIFPDWEGWQLIDQYKQVHGEIRHNQHIESITLDSMVEEHYIGYWHTNNINMINDFSLQYIIFDFAVNSVRTWKKKLQKLLGVKVDGIIGPVTIEKINSYNPEHLFRVIKYYRVAYYKTLAEKGENNKFLNGWLKRINSINYETRS